MMSKNGDVGRNGDGDGDRYRACPFVEKTVDAHRGISPTLPFPPV
jgi:hypothetical protein